ncbi:TPK1 [Symbiodinium necroappetens]|uniref:TPK1 protein n=1 Tax=Symbiodinium necroappetens TaxID=1628268 RepID=A0A813AAR4_9DINO|nr:TPK1 [Symbiodinium necroappetens]
MASTGSDVELLLEDQRPEHRSFAFPRRVALALGCVGLVTIGVLARGGTRGLRSKSGAFVVLDAMADCFEASTYYSSPIKMAGTERTSEVTQEACQQRCLSVDGCAHFTFWPDGGCLLTDESSVASPAPEKHAETVSGPPYCGEKPAAVETDVGIDAEDGEEKASVETPTLAPVPTVAPIPGINGTTCAKYPACVAHGIEEGNCCPNDDNVALGCCMGFPPVVAAPKIAAGRLLPDSRWYTPGLLRVGNGSGDNWRVQLIKNKASGKLFAMKRVQQNKHTSAELAVFKVLDNPYIVRLYNILRDDEEEDEVLFFVMDYCAGGDLMMWMKLREQRLVGGAPKTYRPGLGFRV